MKITNSPYDPTPIGSGVTGVCTFASYKRIIYAMVRANEMTLEDGEFISAVDVSVQGITFIIAEEET